MAHMIETMAYANETPWHGLGVSVHADMTPAEILVKAELDWTVEKRRLYMDGHNGERLETGMSALIRDRDQKILDYVSCGSTWNVTQNAEALEFFNDFIAAGNMSMETAGSLDGGRMVWALAKVKDSFELFGGDRVESYLLFSNPHKYGRTIQIGFTPIRVVCNNTLTLALKGKDASKMISVSHRNKFDGDKVKQLLGVAHDKLVQYKEMAAYLGSKKYAKESVTEYFERVFPYIGDAEKAKMVGRGVSKGAKRASELLETQPGNEFAEGTWWQAFNATSYYIDHEAGREADTRLNNAWFGTGAVKKADALTMALEYAEAA